MKKRLRKKKRIGEYQELGFATGFRFSDTLDMETRNNLLDKFIKQAIEDNDLQFGGGGGGNEWSGFVAADEYRVSATDSHRDVVQEWFIREPLVLEYYATSLMDAWHSDFDNIEVKWLKK